MIIPPSPTSLQVSIHIGASSVSMLVLEPDGDSDMRPGDFLEQSLPLARDIFQKGRVSRETMEHCVHILQGYLETLRELGAGEDTSIRTVATNVLEEANNMDVFSNRIQIGCGLHIETLDDGEMTRLIYLKTRRRLRDTPSMKKRTTLVVHVGPGNTRALLFKKGRISDYSNYRLGIYRTSESVRSSLDEHDSGASESRLIREHIRSQVSQIHHDYDAAEIEELVIIGYEIQHLANELAQPGKTKSTHRALADMATSINTMSEEKRVKTYQLDYNIAQSIIPALEINLAIAEALDVSTLRLPGSDYELGLLLDLHTSSALTDGFQNEVLRSAHSLARKFRVHRSHSAQVTRLAESLFLSTSGLHELDEHDALILKCAAILHECGNFISPRAHHKHSHYIISNSEIFGLGQSDITLIALDRTLPPSLRTQTKPCQATATWTSDDRMRVSKLSAILQHLRMHSTAVTHHVFRMFGWK